MCGIVGLWRYEDPSQVTFEQIASMRDAMAHRGPDGAGCWISPDKTLGLGHRRLSIIDLSGSAAQPMSNADGTLWLTFNGEIYNHAEIREELVSLGRTRWKTDHSDTEVILQAFEQWGIGCLRRFRGMFAFGLWDARQKELWLVRDRVGIKPLYYSLHSGTLSFASEIKALLKGTGHRPEVDETSLFHYLSFLTVPAPKTLFKGIEKLEPGTWLKIDSKGDVQKTCYWDVWDHTSPLVGVSEQDIADLLLAELKTAVQLRKVSDVPVGIFLSGGIDSSTNAALFSERESDTVQTFSIGYEGEHASYQNELHFAREVAKMVGAKHHERLLTLDDLLSFLPQMVHLQDEPIGDPVCIPVFYVSKLARDNGMVVCQVGEGADELFCGYPAWQRAIRFQQYAELPFASTAMRAGQILAGLAQKRESFPYEKLRRAGLGQPVFWSGAEAFTEPHKRQLLSPRIRRETRDLSSWDVIRPTWDRYQCKAWEKSPLNWMSYADLKLRLPELLLMRVDKMSMGVSLEGRVPFLDHKFVELAMSIPSAMKTKDGVLKYILKKAVRGVIPDNIIDRKKQGFGVPIYEWFFERLGDFTQKELSGFCDATDFLDKHNVMQLLKDKRRGPQAWYLLNFALWWKSYVGA